jgi:hypothetical protein
LLPRHDGVAASSRRRCYKERSALLPRHDGVAAGRRGHRYKGRPTLLPRHDGVAANRGGRCSKGTSGLLQRHIGAAIWTIGPPLVVLRLASTVATIAARDCYKQRRRLLRAAAAAATRASATASTGGGGGDFYKPAAVCYKPAGDAARSRRRCYVRPAGLLRTADGASTSVVDAGEVSHWSRPTRSGGYGW